VRNRIGWSAGFTFWYEGGEGMPGAAAVPRARSWTARPGRRKSMSAAQVELQRDVGYALPVVSS